MSVPFARDQAPHGDAEVREALSRRLSKRGEARTMATLLGVSEPYLSQVRNGTKPVPPKVAYLLGYRKVTRWEPIA